MPDPVKPADSAPITINPVDLPPKGEDPSTHVDVPETTESLSGKGLLSSKLFWQGAATAGISAAALLQDSGFIQNNPKLVALIGMISGLLIIFLRCITTKAISIPGISIGRKADLPK